MKVRHLFLWTAALAAMASAPAAQAQDSSPSRSIVPPAGRGYVGLSLGRSRYSVPCGVTSLNCDSTDSSVQISAGSMLGNFWGVELGYLDMGRISRGGGTTKAQGLNLSVVGKAPVWQSLGVFGKIGTTYGRTDTSALLGSGVNNGTDRGFGLSYGAGVSYDFTPQLSATLAWDSHDFHFAGSGRDPVRSTSLGLQYKY
ncbi:outer membrane beta-barrel protein [Caenimonas terrae]|uniref:Outer membrane beta-barrel protein n=1 Tax=Caenimonas terrae TaxID=696074 RepID=A0ABW0NCQ3_9BURK